MNPVAHIDADRKLQYQKVCSAILVVKCIASRSEPDSSAFAHIGMLNEATGRCFRHAQASGT